MWLLLLLLVNYFFEGIDEFLDYEGLTLYLVELVGHETVDLHAEVGCQLTHVLFGHNHLLVLLQYLGGVVFFGSGFRYLNCAWATLYPFAFSSSMAECRWP